MATSPTDQSPRVESPCVRMCTLDDNDNCLGCYRSIVEICAWAGASNEQRQEILLSATKRRSRDTRGA